MRMNARTDRAMSLVEVALAIGILCLCAVSLLGLIPVALNATHDSREAVVVARIYQAVSLDLRENFETSSGQWLFNREGMMLNGAVDGDYQVTASLPVSANLAGSTNPSTRMVRISITNVVRGGTSLIRPIFISYGKD